MKKILILSILLILFTSSVSAHSGRTDSSGGHNCNVGACAGTYHYHNGGGYVAPVYYPPVPRCTPPREGTINGNWTFTKNGCNQDVTITWDKGNEDLFYSIAISKSPGANPGPLSDTSTESYTFKNVTPGKWYINFKSGNSCSWSSTRYWTVDVPKIAPTINYFTQKRISDDSVELSYSAICATNATISSVGVVSLEKNSVTVTPKKDTTYKLVANGKGGTTQQELFVLKPTPTPIPTPTPSPTPTPAKKGFWKWLFG